MSQISGWSKLGHSGGVGILSHTRRKVQGTTIIPGGAIETRKGTNSDCICVIVLKRDNPKGSAKWCSRKKINKCLSFKRLHV